MEIRGPWIQTYLGNAFAVDDHRHQKIEIVDIATALSNQCRYAGHTFTFYSVAEHSVLMARHVQACGWSDSLVMSTLLHDSAEAYLPDIPAPWKARLPDYRELERAIEILIADKFGVAFGHPHIKELDQRILLDEREALLRESPFPWIVEDLEPLGVKIHGWTPQEAKDEFMRTYTNILRRSPSLAHIS